MAEETQSAEPAPQNTSQKRKPTKPVPTDRINYAKQLDILRAYAIAFEANGGKAVKNDDVATIVKMAASTLPHANSFFGEIGLLTRIEGGYTPSQDVMNFHQAYAWRPDTAAHKLAPTLRAAWFGQALLPRLSFRTMDEGEAIAVLAEASGATPDYKSQLVLTLNYLETAGLIERDGGIVKATKQSSAQESSSAPPSATTAPSTVDPSSGSGGIATAFTKPGPGVVQFQINVNVEMKEFAGWSPDRITAFFGGIAKVLAAKGGIETTD
jgi:hypothetical protein